VQRVLAFIVLLVAVACVGATLWLAWIDPARGRELLASSGVASFAPLVVLGVLALAALLLAGLRRSHLALGAVLGAGWLIAGWWVFPQMNADRSARQFIAQLERIADPARELGLLAYHEHFLLHLRRPTINFGHRRFREGDAEIDDAAAWLAERPGRQLLVSEQMMEPCFTAAAAQEVGESSRGRWHLVESAPDPACSARGDPSRAIAYTPASRP
jgi:hypothetical protein